LDDSESTIRVNYLEFGKLTNVLKVSALFVVNHKGHIDTFPQFFVLSENCLKKPVSEISVGLSHNGSNPTQIGSNKLVLFSILEDILCQHFSSLFVIDPLKSFDGFVTLVFVLAAIQLLLELLVLLLSCCFVFSFAQLGQLSVQLSFELVLEHLNILDLVYVFLHDVFHLDELFLVLIQYDRRTDRVNNILELLLREDEFLF
jgi:hypothetical protein